MLGTPLLGVLAGANRYAHVNVLRNDSVNPNRLGMRRVCSDDSVRRAMGCLEEGAAGRWLRSHLDRVVRPLIVEDRVLDIDTTMMAAGERIA